MVRPWYSLVVSYDLFIHYIYIFNYEFLHYRKRKKKFQNINCIYLSFKIILIFTLCDTQKIFFGYELLLTFLSSFLNHFSKSVFIKFFNSFSKSSLKNTFKTIQTVLESLKNQ